MLALAALPDLLHADPLPGWNDGAAKARLTGFVEQVTDPTSRSYVRPAERIAVFDNDGAL